MRSRSDLPQMQIEFVAYPDLPATLDQCIHAVPMQPEQCRSELPQIISVRSRRQPSGSPKRIGGLLLQGRKSLLQIDRACHTRTKLRLVANLQEHRQQSEVRSPTRRLAPNSPVRWIDQDRLVRPNVEPDVGLAPTRKAPRRNADLASLAKLQITILRREQDWQPMARSRKLPHVSGVPSRGLGYSCGAGNQRRKASFEVAYLP
jgi:hypothetical protein